MKTYLASLLIISGVISVILPAPANAGVFNWFSAKKIEYRAPLTTFIGQNIGIGSWDEITEEKKTDIRLAPQTTVIATANPITTKKAPVEIEVKTYVITATAYSSTVDQTDDTPFITAWGTRVRDGVVAANFLPFGTVIRIPEVFGDKTFVVEDRMHIRFSNRVDIWFPSREEALEFGAKRIKIEIVS